MLIISGLGFVLLVLHGAHYFAEIESIRSILLGILMPLVLSMFLFVSGGWLWWRKVNGAYLLRMGIWCLVGSGVLAFGGILTIGYQMAHGAVLDHKVYVIASWATAGGFVGLVLGVYDVQRLKSRARAERFSQQLTVLNRVLRHNVRNGANVISGWADHLGDGNGDADQVESIQAEANDLVKLGERARKVERVLQSDGDRREAIDLVGILETEISRVREGHPGLGVRDSLSDEATVSAHPLIESAITSLFDDMVERTSDRSSRVEVACFGPEQTEGNWGTIRITHGGESIPDQVVVALERGYETPLEHGCGLNLWVVKWIVTNSGGEIEFDETASGMTTVTVRLPPPETERTIGGTLRPVSP